MISNNTLAPVKYLKISRTEKILTLQVKQKKFLFRTIFYGFFICVLLFAGLYFCFSKMSGNNFQGLSFDTANGILVILFFIFGYIVSIIYIKLLYRLFKSNGRTEFLTYIESTNQIVFTLFLFFFIVPQLFNIYNYKFLSIVSFTYAMIFYEYLQLFRNSNITIEIEKSSDNLKLIAYSTYPLINLAPSWLTIRESLIETSPDELFLTISPAIRFSNFDQNQLKRRLLIKQKFFSLEEALKYSKLKNQFICMLIDKRIEEDKKFGLAIGYAISVSTIQEILAFMNQFAPCSIFKIERKPKNVNFPKRRHLLRAQNPTTKKIIEAILFPFLILFYLIAIIISLVCIYLAFTAPETILKIEFALLFIMMLLVFIIPPILLLKIRNYKKTFVSGKSP